LSIPFQTALLHFLGGKVPIAPSFFLFVAG
jgi:hypothetical protein